MAYIPTKGKFHVGLDGQGLILQGAPDRIAYSMQQAPVYGQRFASGDRGYNDLSMWWYWAQSDWSGGLKDRTSWSDDATYYFATNIDTWSSPGQFKIAPTQYPAASGGDEDFGVQISCGHSGEINGTTYKLIGTYEASDDRPHVYRSALGVGETWTDISTTNIGTEQNTISQMITRGGILWVLTVGAGTAYKVNTYDGSSWVDQTTYVDSVGVNLGGSSRTGVFAESDMYIFTDDTGADSYKLVKTSVNLPTGGGDYELVFEKTRVSGYPVSSVYYNGSIYYLVAYGSYAELRQYNIATDTETLVQKFLNASLPSSSVGNKLLNVLNGKLIITIPNSEIWELNGSVITRIFTKDKAKANFSYTGESTVYLRYGCVEQDNKLWWGNLVYDGTYFHNTWKDHANFTTDTVYPMFTDKEGNIWESSSDDNESIWSVNPINSVYKTAANKNYIVFSNFDNVAQVDKLANSFTLLFKPLASNESIVVKYSTGDFTSNGTITWTTLGTASNSLDGGTVTDKTFYFPSGTIFKKLWIRIDLTSGGTTTPTVLDTIVEYLPVPTYKKLWQLRINCADELKRLDGRLHEMTGRELKARLETAWWTKSTLDFQDLDYATTTLSDNPLTSSSTTVTVASTVDFPEQGRIKIDDEEITYTGKTSTTFTGCTRGARGTRAASHSQGAVVNNAYKVILSELSQQAPIVLQDKHLEYIVQVTLREV